MRRVCINCKHCRLSYKDRNKKEHIKGFSCDKKGLWIIHPKSKGKHHKEVLEDFIEENTLPMECFEK